MGNARFKLSGKTRAVERSEEAKLVVVRMVSEDDTMGFTFGYERREARVTPTTNNYAISYIEENICRKAGLVAARQSCR